MKAGKRIEDRGERVASEGTIQTYLHHNAKIGVLVEVDCETDFVGEEQRFRRVRARGRLAHRRLARARWVSEDEVPAELREAELRIFEQEAADKPEEIRAKIAEGKLAKWYGEVVLLDQPHVNADKHEGATIAGLLHQIAAQTGENVVIRRFARFAIGE